MRQPVLLCLAAAASFAAAGHVSVSISRERFSHPRAKLARRQGNDDSSEPFALDALNNITGGGYYSEFEVGTPPQQISFLLDTGSSDTWVNSVDADLCNSNRLQSTMGFCQTQFNQDDSSTFETVDRNGFDITYLDGRNIQGDYFEDTVHFGGNVSVEKQQLGLALTSVRPTGIMGLGFSSNVAASRTYATIIENMVDQGFIDTAAFSLYLNDLSTDSGNILFGGIDTKKFIGELALLPLVSDEAFGGRVQEITSFNVRLEGFDVQNPDGDRAIDLANLDSFAILDSGSTISLLPDDQVQDIWDEFGVLAFRDVLAPFIDCAYAGDKGDGYIFEFRFDNKTIQVPMDEMVIDAYADVQDQILSDDTLRDYFDGWDGVCMFGIGSTGDFGISTDQFTLLGATFLRSAYVVYDLENEQLGLAQANVNSSEEDIVEITSGSLPDVTGVESQSPSTTTSDSSSTTSDSTTTASSTATSDGGSGSETTTTDSSSNAQTETDSGSGATNTAGNDEGAASHLAPSIASLVALFGIACVLL